MTGRAKKLYDSACKNEKFLKDIWEADGDEKPGVFASEERKRIYTSFYYGWLVGKFGKEWEQNL